MSRKSIDFGSFQYWRSTGLAAKEDTFPDKHPIHSNLNNGGHTVITPSPAPSRPTILKERGRIAAKRTRRERALHRNITQDHAEEVRLKQLVELTLTTHAHNFVDDASPNVLDQFQRTAQQINQFMAQDVQRFSTEGTLTDRMKENPINIVKQAREKQLLAVMERFRKEAEGWERIITDDQQGVDDIPITNNTHAIPEAGGTIAEAKTVDADATNAFQSHILQTERLFRQHKQMKNESDETHVGVKSLVSSFITHIDTSTTSDSCLAPPPHMTG